MKQLEYLNKEETIIRYGFCIGVAKYVSSRKVAEISPVSTVFAGFLNSFMISIISSLVPEKIRFSVILIDFGCLSYNFYVRRKKLVGRAPPTYSSMDDLVP